MSHGTQFGVCAAVSTPFAADGSIDVSLFTGHIKQLLTNGCDRVAVFGTTGEGSSVGPAEARNVLHALRKAGIEGTRMVASVIASSVEEVLAKAELARELGCRHLLVAPPYYYKDVTDAALKDWYSSILMQWPGGLQMILYNIPQLTGVPIPVAMVAELKREFPDFIYGVKDSAGNWRHTKALLEIPGDVAVLVGDERHVADAVALGSAGTISGIANFRPDIMAAIIAGRPAEPGLKPLVEAIVAHPVTPAVKALLAHLSGEDAWRSVRPPLEALSPSETEGLVKQYEGLFEKTAA